MVGELNDLKIGDTSEIWDLSKSLLNEIAPSDYAGGRPPMKSYEPRIMGKELFAFSWFSETLGNKMYIKFALQDGEYYYVSLHEDRPPKIKMEKK